ncbi:Uncharacterized protein TCM_042953 [Theobroma cacao]|uniref:Uncharacterized protein n=1 Tax=Theobroma cacao TaxID=3641 RepID=A0A061FN76_THECC|nr:Uncharacterized protein TCM_042953 [Theobroma cacao]
MPAPFDSRPVKRSTVPVMAATTVSLKLLVDQESHRALFAEAGKDVDFLFNILSLPLGTVIRLLNKQGMVGCLGDLYDSIENLADNYMQPTANKDTLLKPMVFNIAANPNNTDSSSAERGYVKGVVTYMIMDDLTVRPTSTTSSITSLNKFNVKDVAVLEEKSQNGHG